MRARRALLAALVLALAPAVPAGASHATAMDGQVLWTGDGWGGYCRLHAVAEETTTGGQDTYTGSAAGVGWELQPVGNVDVHCIVKVNGSVVQDVSDGQTTGVDTAAGQVTFTASDTDTVELCVGLGGGHGGSVCASVTRRPVPSQAVEDVVFGLTHVADSILCPVLRSLSPGVPGLVDVTFEGDVYVLGAPVHDCPPYN